MTYLRDYLLACAAFSLLVIAWGMWSRGRA